MQKKVTYENGAISEGRVDLTRILKEIVLHTGFFCRTR